jgi:hypothetical protein
MKIEVSDGEVVDKYSILCLKLELITNEDKKKQVQHEKQLLHDYATFLINRWPMYYSLLFHVNKQIWDKTDEMKAFHMPNDPEAFAKLSQDIFSLNDQRFRLKRIFNMDSNVQEQKSYADKTIHISIPSQEVLINKLDELISMVLRYDKIFIILDKEKQLVMDMINYWLPPFCVAFLTEIDDHKRTNDDNYPPVDLATLAIIGHFTNVHA